MRQKMPVALRSLFIIVLLGLLSLLCFPVYAADPLPFGNKLPAFDLTMPDSPDAGQYLGLPDKKTFVWSQIPANLIVIELFSVFCPKCQANTATFNQLFEIIKDNPELNKDVRMIGIALLSPANQVEVFKRTFKAKYPLFADPMGSIQTKTMVNSVPLTLVVDKSGNVLMSHLGMMKDLDAFLRDFMKLHKARQTGG